MWRRSDERARQAGPAAAARAPIREARPRTQPAAGETFSAPAHRHQPPLSVHDRAAVEQLWNNRIVDGSAWASARAGSLFALHCTICRSCVSALCGFGFAHCRPPAAREIPKKRYELRVWTLIVYVCTCLLSLTGDRCHVSVSPLSLGSLASPRVSCLPANWNSRENIHRPFSWSQTV